MYLNYKFVWRLVWKKIILKVWEGSFIFFPELFFVTLNEFHDEWWEGHKEDITMSLWIHCFHPFVVRWKTKATLRSLANEEKHFANIFEAEKWSCESIFCLWKLIRSKMRVNKSNENIFNWVHRCEVFTEENPFQREGH